ncbi:hypothetical protein OQA88_13260 [Cercophora sp. LCS_1]
MEIPEIISYLEALLNRPRPGTLGQAPFTSENPHTCAHCQTLQLRLQTKTSENLCWACKRLGVKQLAPSGGYVCPHCNEPYLITTPPPLRVDYSIRLDYNLTQATEAAHSGCDLYRWLTGATARNIHCVSDDWRAHSVMASIGANVRYTASGHILLEPHKNDSYLLEFSLVCDDKAFQRDPLSIGRLCISAEASEPASRHVRTRPYERDVRSAQSMRFAKNCFSTCMEKHTWCRTDQIGHLALDRTAENVLPKEKIDFRDIPTRLLDVGTVERPVLRLVETTDGDGALLDGISEAGFMVLSYCWGGDQEAKLLNSRLAEYKRGLSLDAFSRTLQDAVWVARETAFRYLWVDSLCILQDDMDGLGNNPDKAVEITRMASYYGRATITLCAASSERAVYGFLGLRESTRYGAGPIRIQICTGDGVASHGYLTSEIDQLTGTGDDPEPITGRGWTLQESLLSRRILIFARRPLYWSCLNSIGGCGGDMAGLGDRVMPGHHSFVVGVFPAGVLIDMPTAHQWGVIVKDYTLRGLGRGSDKLWAISALAQHMVGMSKARGEDALYVAGLLVDRSRPSTWLSQLLWSPKIPTATRPAGYRAPSWSWASIDGPVTMDTVSWGTQFAKVEFWSVQLFAEIAPYGALTGAHLVLSAKVQPLLRLKNRVDISWGNWHDDFGYHSARWGGVEGSEDRWALIILADGPQDKRAIEVGLASDRGTASQVLLVGVHQVPTSGVVGVAGLIMTLQSDTFSGEGEAYRLLGSFQLRSENDFNDRSESNVYRFFEEADTAVLTLV